MPSALVIPGVQVRTVFEPSPALPSLTGVLGVVGVADRGPLEPTPVGSMSEFLDIFGPASRYTMPEVQSAFANGVSEIFVARTAPGRGQKARRQFNNDDGDPMVTIVARGEGAWGNQIAIQFTQVKTLSGHGVKYVNFDVYLGDKLVESHNSLVTDETSPNYLYDYINQQSRLVVALDPAFDSGLPITTSATKLTDGTAKAAFTTLKVGAADVLRVDAKQAGLIGDRISVRVREGQASLPLAGAANAPSVEIQAKKEGTDGANIRVSVVAAGNSVSLVITPSAGVPRTLGPFSDVDSIVAGFVTDPDVQAIKRGTVLPAPVANPTPLARHVHIDVMSEGRDSTTYLNQADLNAIAGQNDPLVTFSIVGGATQLPDATVGQALSGGREAGPELDIAGDARPDPLLELYAPAPLPGAVSVAVTRGVSTLDNTTAVIGVDIAVDNAIVESYRNLTMDPDDQNYLPAVLHSSALIRARDLIVRGRTTTLPSNMARPQKLSGGISSSTDDYSDALERLETAEDVDMVIASVANQLNSASVRKVHQLVTAHCAKMAEVARNRIGIGSVTADETRSVASILDHADDVRSDYFMLCTPAAMEGAVAGLLARLDYWDSPTFKNVLAPDGDLVPYTDPQLIQLIEGNTFVVTTKRRLGIIAVKGLLTSGRQVNVQRTAHKAVRDVKAICDVYIGLLNTDGSRNALKQQITAMFMQMERDGAIVPSTDGKDPSYTVNVYSTQSDFASGIVRVDIGVRPVRAIDYIYATILVKN
jgi:hypothetical protein